jgi:hypothetical protein
MLEGVLELARLMRGPPGKEGGREDDQHREREVAHHPAVVERAADREAAEDSLPDDAQGKQRAEPHQVAPVGAATHREQPGGARGDRDRTGDQPV